MTDDDKTSQTIILKDGRKLGYAEYGNSKGSVILYFHGHRSSRFEPKMYDFRASLNNIRLIAIDRPGLGLSDFKQDRTILDWPDDVVELADALQIDNFAVLGGSGGGPFAAACAYKIPDKLIACGIVSGLGPIEFGTEGMAKNNRLELSLASKRVWLLKFLFKLQNSYAKRLAKKDRDSLIKIFHKRAKDLPEPDRKIFEDQEKILLYLKLMTEPFCQGYQGPFHEAKLLGNPWGFDLKEISPKGKVFLWHGELDPSVPIRMARSVCEAIPNCEGKFYPDEGHLSVAVNHIEEILTTLTL